jgi:small subunit ribosomal protein S4e
MSKHLKRLAAPRSWPVRRKTNAWVARPQPGPHPLSRSIPLQIIVRDILSLVDSRSEARKVLASRAVLVDNRVVTEPKRAVGLMDTVSIPKMDAHYRVLVDYRGMLALVPIAKSETSWKLARVERKMNLRGRKWQIGLHDGRSIRMDKCPLRAGDTLKIEVPSQRVVEHYPFAPGNVAYIIGGSHVGQVARVEGVDVVRSSAPNLVRFREGFSTTRNHVFIAGTQQAGIKVPETQRGGQGR